MTARASAQRCFLKDARFPVGGATIPKALKSHRSACTARSAASTVVNAPACAPPVLYGLGPGG
jgi:hypothetical protein